jgi:DNA-binding FadR family transcriptional regulator
MASPSGRQPILRGIPPMAGRWIADRFTAKFRRSISGESAGVIDKRLYPSGALHGQVAHDIGRRIVSGEIAEGAALPREAELSQQFSVSRQAVREALKVLAAKGLVKSRRRSGTHVMPRASWNLLDPDVLAWHQPGSLSPDFLSDLGELRWLIEPAAAGLAASRGDPAGAAHVAEALEAMRRAIGNPESFYAADVEFHLSIFSASGNALIERLSTILGPLLEASFRQQQGADSSSEALVAVHAAVYDAIVAGDAARARHSMESLLQNVSDQIAVAPPTALARTG